MLPLPARGRIPADAIAAHERALLESARALFLNLGYDRVTVEALARTAHVSPKTIYARYGGKDGLFVAAMLPVAEQLTATLDEDPSDERAMVRALSRFGERLLSVTLSPGALRFQRLLSSDGARFPKLARAFYANGPARGLAALAAFFERCNASGVARCPNPKETAEFFLGALQGECLRRGLLFDERLGPAQCRARSTSAARAIVNALRH